MLSFVRYTISKGYNGMELIEKFMNVLFIGLFLTIFIVTIMFYIMVGIKYLQGRFQYSVFLPGKWLMPRRITKSVRESVITLYRTLPLNHLEKMEGEIRCYLSKNSPNTIRLSLTQNQATRYKLLNYEDSFLYFIYIYELLAITGLSLNPSNLTKATLIEAKKSLRAINLLVSKKYVKRAMSLNDRYLVIGEILFRIANDCYQNNPYGTDFWLNRVRMDIAYKHIELIEGACNDEEIIRLVKDNINFNILPIHSETTTVNKITFLAKVALVGKWL